MKPGSTGPMSVRSSGANGTNIEKIAKSLKTEAWKLLKPDLLDA
jgi:hypothetical protein